MHISMATNQNCPSKIFSFFLQKLFKGTMLHHVFKIRSNTDPIIFIWACVKINSQLSLSTHRKQLCIVIAVS